MSISSLWPPFPNPKSQSQSHPNKQNSRNRYIPSHSSSLPLKTAHPKHTSQKKLLDADIQASFPKKKEEEAFLLIRYCNHKRQPNPISLSHTLQPDPVIPSSQPNPNIHVQPTTNPQSRLVDSNAKARNFLKHSLSISSPPNIVTSSIIVPQGTETPIG